MEFVKLEKPVTYVYKFDEAFISPDVYFNYFTTVTASVTDLTYFALREFLQNAIDQVILETGDLANSYKKVDVKYENGKYIIKSPGVIPEEAFALGFTTKRSTNIPEPCCLIGHFGVGMKQAIGSLVLRHKKVFVSTGGHVYTFAGYCNGKVEVTDVREECKLVILRGKSDVGDMTVVEMEGQPLTTSVLWSHPTRVWEEGSAVYHNGMYSGKWELPFSVNICCVEADEYRERINTFSRVTRLVLRQLVSSLTTEERETLIRGITKSYTVRNNMFVFNYPRGYTEYFGIFATVFADAIERIAKTEKISPVVIADSMYADLPPYAFIFDVYGTSELGELVKELKKRGIDAYTYEEWSKQNRVEELIKNTYKTEELPDYVLSGILAGKWLFNNTLYRLMGHYDYACLSDTVLGTPIYVVRESFKLQERHELGVTLTVIKNGEEKHYIFLAPPQRVSTSSLRSLSSKEHEALRLAYTSITFHELIHAMFPEYQHGTAEFESPYYVLMSYLGKQDALYKFSHNIVNVAYLLPRVLDGVRCVLGIDYYVIEPAVFEMLQNNDRVPVTISNNYVYLSTMSMAEFILKMKKEGDTLEFKFDPVS